jgi:hypothetical protein
MRARRIGPGLATLLLATAVHAQDKPCSKGDADAAAKALDKVVTWGQLEKAWRDYRQCDSPPVDAQFTEAMMRIMVDWKLPEQLGAAVDKDPEYKAFVIRHVKSPAAADDRPDVYSRAKGSCPAGMTAFCADLAEAAKTSK